MPRKPTKLLPFLKNALDGAKYINLNYEDDLKRVFCLYLPHKTKRLEKEMQYIFRDWYSENKKEYVFYEDYTVARQCITASLRKSDYIDLMHLHHNKLICRILNKEEVEEKKQKKKQLMKQREKEKDETESVESGYNSGLNSPEICLDCEQSDKNALQYIAHDHAYVFSPLGTKCSEEIGISSIQEDSNEDMITDAPSEKLNLLDTYSKEDFSKIPLLPETVTLEDLDKISASSLIGGNTETEKLYMCVKTETLGDALVMFCKLLQNMDAGISETSSNIIIFDEVVQEKIQSYKCLKKWEKIDDDYLMVILTSNVNM